MTQKYRSLTPNYDKMEKAIQKYSRDKEKFEKTHTGQSWDEKLREEERQETPESRRARTGK